MNLSRFREKGRTKRQIRKLEDYTDRLCHQLDGLERQLRSRSLTGLQRRSLESARWHQKKHIADTRAKIEELSRQRG